MFRSSVRIAVTVVPLLLGACAHSPTYDPQDPLEPMNRAIYRFNEKLDTYVAQPVARGYTHAVPQEVRGSVSHFLDNLGYPTVIVNDLLQGKFKQSASDSARFLMNTTFGLAGLLDPATMIGLERHKEDFGQTLGRWGVGQGWYLMLPLLGPSTNRELVGRGVNVFTNPTHYADFDTQMAVTGLDVVDTRAKLLGSEAILRQQFDRYVFVRSAYLQRRRAEVYDGSPPPEDDGWDN